MASRFRAVICVTLVAFLFDFAISMRARPDSPNLINQSGGMTRGINRPSKGGGGGGMGGLGGLGGGMGSLGGLGGGMGGGMGGMAGGMGGMGALGNLGALLGGMGGGKGGGILGASGSSIAGLEKIIKSVTSLTKEATKMFSAILPKLRQEGVQFYKGIMSEFPNFVQNVEPEMRRMMQDLKEPAKELLHMMEAMSERIHRAEWGTNLDSYERALTFCPRANVSLFLESTMSSADMEEQLTQQCVVKGCDGHFDLCCPVFISNTRLEAKCVYSHKKHWGVCPDGKERAKFDQPDVEGFFNDPTKFPQCKQDSDCAINEKCCTSDASGPAATCVPGVEDANNNYSTGVDYGDGPDPRPEGPPQE